MWSSHLLSTVSCVQTGTLAVLGARFQELLWCMGLCLPPSLLFWNFALFQYLCFPGQESLLGAVTAVRCLILHSFPDQNV